MSRLTNNIREQMARKLVNHRYTDEAKELVRLNKTLAERAYDHCYTKEIVGHMEAIKKVFPSAFREYNIFNVNAGGFKVDLGGQVRSRWITVMQETPRKFVIAGDSYTPHNITDEKLIEEIKAFAIRREDFNDVCSTAYSEAMSVLNTMTTGKKLAEAWPEAMDVIGGLIPEDQRTLPVVQVSAINAKFKLPPETKTKETV